MTEPDASSARPRGGRGSRFRVDQWFGIAAALLAAVTLVGVVAGVIAVVRLDEDDELVIDTLDPAALAALRLSNALVDEATGVRGYALFGGELFLRPYRNGLVRERVAVRELRDLAATMPDGALGRDLDVVERRARAWRAEYARPAIETVRERGAGALERELVRRGRRLFGDVRDALARQRANIAAARAEGRASRDEAFVFLAIAFGAIAVLVATALITTMVMLRRSVTLPLASLARRVQRVASGEYELDVRSHGPRDIGALAADVDAMRQEIVQELEALRQAHDKLDSQARELERSNAELEQFAYVASHDLQEPLRKVASFCQLLQQRYAGQLDERADEYIAFTVDGAKRMQQLINDLLAFSRVGRRGGELMPAALDAALATALRNLDTAIGESGARIDADPLPTVRGEASLLALVFQNLIGNAIKFRAANDPRIEIRVERDGADWLISCSDEGIGIDPDYAERVFAIFQRLHPKEQYAGTGIGLAICRKIVEYHGGRIWLDTSAAATTFRLTLPVLEEDDDRATTPAR